MRLRAPLSATSIIPFTCDAGPARITPMRVPRVTASSMSWVMNSTVVRAVCQMRASSICMSIRVWASSAAKGSSISSIFGSFTSARAIWIRCFIPPDSSAGYFSSWPSSPTSSRKRRARSRRSAFGTCRMRRPNSTFSIAVSQPESESSPWNTTPRSRLAPVTGRPSIRICPDVGASKPASSFSTVVLPQPLGPSRQKNSLDSISTLKCSTAT